mgnify:CR=1 FL=1
MIAAVGVLVAWTALQKWEFPSAQHRQGDYYNLLARGFSKGSLALDLEVSPALKAAENPWDSTKRPPGAAPADVTYFNGKFYLYFGVVPVVLVIWPFQLLTGLDLPLVYVVIGFCLAAYFLLARLWLTLLDEHFPRASAWTALSGLWVLGLGGGLLALARRGSIWEMPIAAGQCFMVATALAAYRAIHAARPWRWLATAGIFLGLAVGSRPTLATAGGGMVVLVLAVGFGGGRRGWIEGGRRAAVAAVTAGGPLAIIVAALLAYNHARFGKWLEFGLNYQLTAGYEAKAQHFSLGFIRYNWLMYFWNSPQWGRDFPFLHPVQMDLKQPPGYYGYEYVYGALKISPLLWLGLILPGWWLKSRKGGRLAAFAGFLAALTVGLTATLLCFNTAAARYTADFLPWWLLMGLLGWSVVESRLKGVVWLRRTATTVVVAGALFTGGVAYCASVELHGVFRFLNPVGYAAVARVFNRPVAWIEWWLGRPVGEVELEIEFAARPGDTYEPLVTTGVSYESSYVFAHFTAPDKVRFGFSQGGKANVETEELAFEPGRTYRLQIGSGALYPPKEHPRFASWSDVEIASVKDWVSLKLDGRVILEARYPVNDAAPGHFQVGTDRGAGRRFSGKIKVVRRAGFPEIARRGDERGDVVITTRFPDAGATAPQPLVMAGRTGNADIVSYRRIDAKTMAVGYESWSAGFWESAPLALPEEHTGKLRVRLGSMLDLDDRTPLGILRETVAVWLDEKPVWWRGTVLPVVRPVSVEVGMNTIHSTAVTQRYEGRVAHWECLPAPHWRSGPFQSVELLLGGRGEGVEPLAATGASGRADTLGVEWRPGGRARLVYDHWGSLTATSEEFDWSGDLAHRVRIELPSFAWLDRSELGTMHTGQARVWFDEKPVWESEVAFFVARSDETMLARNRAGSTVTGEKLRVSVLDLQQSGARAGAR